MLDVVLAGVTGLILAVVLSRPPKAAPTPEVSEPAAPVPAKAAAPVPAKAKKR